MAQDGIGRGQVEIEVRRDEAQQVLASFEAYLMAAKIEVHILLLAAVDLLGMELVEIVLRALDAIGKLGERGLDILETRRLDAGEVCDAAFGQIRRDLYLLYHGKHVGKEPRLQQHRRVDFLFEGVGLTLLQNRRETVELLAKKGHRGLIHR